MAQTVTVLHPNGLEANSAHNTNNTLWALDKTFTAYGVELEQVEIFKYIRRKRRYNDSTVQAVHDNIRKSRAVYGRLS